MNFMPKFVRPLSRTHLFWLFHVTFWLSIGLISFILVTNFYPSHDAAWLIVYRIASGFILTLALSRIYMRPFMRRQTAPIKCLLAAIFTVLALLVAMLLLKSLARQGIVTDFKNAQQQHGIQVARFLVLVLWNGLYFTFDLIDNLNHSELRAAVAETVAKDHELKHLQAQMNPHFLFNALNAINAHNDNPVVTNMLRHLAAYLRFSLTPCRPLEPLSRELDALESYLMVQKLRFGDQMRCSISCDTESHSILVPPMMIQPLLENAYNYGPKTSSVPLQIAVSARVENGFLKITVANSGQWVQPGNHASTGTGISSLRKRLALLASEDASLEVEKTDGWVRIHIQLPATHPPAKS